MEYINPVLVLFRSLLGNMRLAVYAFSPTSCRTLADSGRRWRYFPTGKHTTDAVLDW